jgi:hypothetical protein
VTIVEMLSDHSEVKRPHKGIATGAESVGSRGNPVQLEWFAKFWQTSKFGGMTTMNISLTDTLPAQQNRWFLADCQM